MKAKTSKCLHCKEKSPKEKGMATPRGFFCSYKHAMEYAQAQAKRAQERSKIKKARQAKVETKESRAALREANRQNLNWQHNLTQKSFNRLRVLEELLWFKERGLEPTCISCGNSLGNDQWCAGHFKTVGAQSNLRYDRKNVYLQHNVRCNRHLSGDIHGTKTTRGYIQGLKDRFGEEEAQAIIDYCESNTQPAKWYWQDIEEMRKSFNKRIRTLF